MTNTLVRHMISLPQLPSAHGRLQKTLVALCKEVQKIVSSGLSGEVDAVQHEAGLELIIHQGGCPQRVLLLPPHRLAHLTPQGQPRPTWATTDAPETPSAQRLGDEALTQIDHILASLDEERASQLAEILDALLRQSLRDEPLEINDHDLLKDNAEGFQPPEFNETAWERVRRLLGDELLGDSDIFTPAERGDGDYVVVDPLAVYRSRATMSPTPSQVLCPTELEVIQGAAPEIEYYALKLLMCAARRRLSLPSLTRVVRVHELAHLVTHLGLDASWQHWHTFHSASVDHIEGSAQDITHRLLERRLRLELMKPYAKRRAQSKRDLYSFKVLLRGQSRPYLIHTFWRSQMDHQDRRDWLIKARVTGNFAPF